MTKQLLKSKKIVIFAGHGGYDPGAVSGAIKEKDLTLKVAKYLRIYFERLGAVVLMIKETDTKVDLSRGTNMANQWGADLYLDIHFNAGGGNGFEVFCSKVGGFGRTVAEAIAVAVKEIGQEIRGVKTKLNDAGNDYYHSIRETNMPALILEGAFVDNPADIKDFDEDWELDRYALKIAKGVCIAWDQKVTDADLLPDKPKPVAKTYIVQAGVYADKANAQKMVDKLNGLKIESIIVEK